MKKEQETKGKVQIRQKGANVRKQGRKKKTEEKRKTPKSRNKQAGQKTKPAPNHEAKDWYPAGNRAGGDKETNGY